MGLQSGSDQQRPDDIYGELQFEELEILSDRQAEALVGGFTLPGLNSEQTLIVKQALISFKVSLLNSFGFTRHFS